MEMEDAGIAGGHDTLMFGKINDSYFSLELGTRRHRIINQITNCISSRYIIILNALYSDFDILSCLSILHSLVFRVIDTLNSKWNFLGM
jgi:hypothetical protein